MSEPTDKPDKGTAAAGADDTKNLKAEFNRKLDNVSASMQKNFETLQAQLAKMTAPQKQPPSATPNDDLENLFYKDPKAYAAKIQEQTEARILERLANEGAANQKRQTTIQSLYKEFPELNQDESELTKLALTKYEQMQKEYGDSGPATYKAAVAEAALELGVKPKSKRPQEEESFSVGGRGDRRPARKKDELDAGTLEAARLMGLDDKAVERMKARVNGRKNFGKWE